MHLLAGAYDCMLNIGSYIECFDLKYNIVINDGYFDKAINIIHISCCEMFVQPQEIINKYIEVQWMCVCLFVFRFFLSLKFEEKKNCYR